MYYRSKVAVIGYSRLVLMLFLRECGIVLTLKESEEGLCPTSEVTCRTSLFFSGTALRRRMNNFERVLASYKSVVHTQDMTISGPAGVAGRKSQFEKLLLYRPF